MTVAGESRKPSARGRSSLPETRNPLLKLPAARRIAALEGEPRELLRALLTELGQDANRKAADCWKKHKAPMAAYWKAAAVYARHIARLLGRRRAGEAVAAVTSPAPPLLAVTASPYRGEEDRALVALLGEVKFVVTSGRGPGAVIVVATGLTPSEAARRLGEAGARFDVRGEGHFDKVIRLPRGEG